MSDRLGECERCSEQAVGFNDYGEALCEDCMFEDFMEDSTLLDE